MIQATVYIKMWFIELFTFGVQITSLISIHRKKKIKKPVLE